MVADYNVFLEIRRLALSSPEHVYAYLESKGKEGLPYGISEALFQLNNRLINLGLARYSDDGEVLAKLFRTSSAEDKESLRCGVLANPKCDLSNSLFASLEQEELKAVLENGTELELQAMLSNRSLEGTKLAEILSRSGLAQSLSDDRWFLCVILGLAVNPSLKTEFKSPFPVGYSSGWEAYKHGEALKAAWNVLETAPLTEKWAVNLGRIFSKRDIALHYQCDDAFFTRVFERWKSDDPKPEKSFSELRMWVGANVPPESHLHVWMAGHEDFFIRQGHYYSFDTHDPEDLDQYFARDGHKFIEVAIENGNLYRTENVRSHLRQLVDEDCHTRSDWFDLDLFDARWKRFAKQDPSYLSQTEPITIGLLNQALEQFEERLLAHLNKMISGLRRSIF